MENRFENTPPEEKQGWGAYATPPPYPGQKSPEQTNKLPVLPQVLTMCDRVRERLPYLMENSDGEISADTVRALYGHLSVCETCSREFDEHQRIVSYLDAMPPVQMPMDFTGAIQRRIQVQAMSPQTEAVVSPAATRAFGTPPVTAQNCSSTPVIAKRTLTSSAAVISTLKKTTTTSTLQLTGLENGLMRRLTTGSITAAIMAYYVSSSWGREMLGANITAIRAWLDQIGAVFGRIPILGRLALLVFTALAQIGDLLGNTYRTVGDMAVRGLAMDIGVCMAAYYFLVVRRQRDSSWIRRV
jgi:hypothetical protein